MSARPGPTLRAQWLGQQLKELRTAANMTLKQTGEYLQRDTSTVSRFESGEYPVRRPDLLAMLELYSVTDKPKREALIALHEDAWQQGWWDDFAGDIDPEFFDFVWLESRATEIRGFEPTLIAGLLQTEDYARAVMIAVSGREDVERALELRMARQQVLDRGQPPHIGIVLDQGTLYRQVGGPEVLAAQLVHLTQLARRSNVEIRVLPFSAGAHVGTAGPFKLLRMNTPYPEVGYAESPTGADYVVPPRTGRFTALYDQLLQVALDPQESIELIVAVAEEMACT